MPLFSISTSAKISEKKKFLEDSSRLISELTNKPEKFVMVILNDSPLMYFDKNQYPCCYIEIKSIGNINQLKMSEEISKFITSSLGIPEERLYINFQDIEAKNWAWKSKPFG